MSLMRSLMRLRKKRRAVFQKQNRVFFESLEPRLLLSAAPTAEITTPASVGDWLIVSTASDGKCFYTPVQEGAAFGTTQQFDDKDPTGWSAGIGDFDGDNVLEALVGDNGHTWYFDNDGSGNILEDDSPIDSTFYPGERRDFAEADFNNDGKLEAVMWAEYSTNVTYYKVYGHDGNGNFTLLNTSSTQGNKYIYGMDAADFNNDGKMDFVAGSYSSGAYVYIGNGDLTFQIPTKAITVGNAYGVSAGDFNNDGKADIIFGTRFYKGNGDGTFIYTNDIAFSPYSALAEADIDGDGNLDLLYTGATASGGSNGNNLYYRKGNGNGTFKNPAGNYNPLIHSFGNSINGLAISQKPPKGIWEYNEGATVLFSGTSRDLDVADTLTFHWDWGDGTSTDIPGINDPLNNQIRTGNTSHVYADNGEYLVRLTVTDNESPNNKSSVPAAMSIKIRNAEPTIEAGPDRSVSEGLALSLAPATFNDLGTLDTHTASIDWGDGVVESGSLTEIPFGPPGSTSGANGTISGNHTYGDDGIYTVTVTVTDDDQAMASDSFTVTVANVAPALTLIGEAEINEGSVYTLGLASEDPGTDTISSWTINWGDMTEIVSGNPSSVTHTYADGPVSYTISATATDEDGTYDGSNTVGVTVNNVAPTVDAGPDATIDEGGAFTITGIFSDPGADTWAATVDYGDGSGAQPLALSPDKTFALSHVYADNGTYMVIVSVTDDDTDTGSDVSVVTVNNVAPTVSAGADQAADEGSAVSFSGAFTDPGADSYIYQWDFGDGATADSLSSNHVYADNGTYTATLTVTDDDGGVDTDSLVVTVNNVAPAVNAGPDATIDEGGAFTITGIFSDPGADTWAATVDYGDGSGAQPLALSPDKTFALSHVYADNGTYMVIVSVTDDDTDTGSDVSVVTVNNVAPTVSAGADQKSDEGSTLSFSGAFTDPGADSYVCLWDFGDGATADSLSSNHVYADNGTYTATLTVTDDDGGVDTDSLVVTVNNVAPAVNAGPDATIDEGGAFTITGIFSDPGADTWAATVDYGDGSGAQPLALSPDKTFALNHVYADNGTYRVTVSVTDDDTDTGSGVTVVTVSNVAPTVSAGADQKSDEGSTLSFSGAFTDPGADSYVCLWDFGDGTTADSLSSDHLYADNGTYTAILTVIDDDGGVGTDSLVVTVNNFVPTVNAGPDATIDEGGTFAGVGSFVDPGMDVWTATVNYGDGSGDQTLSLNADKTFNLSHVYAKSGGYDVTVKITDDDSGEGVDTAKVTVNSVGPAVPGARINDNGDLEIIGTAGRDNVVVNAKGKNNEWVEVTANFLPGKNHTQKFKASDFNKIVIIVGDGNDHVTVDKKIMKQVTIDGGSGNDCLKAGGGPTTLLGGAGNDKLMGSAVNDEIFGGDGNDFIFGKRGNDKLYGESGNDLLVGGPGNDILDGGSGRDRLIDRTAKHKKSHPSKNQAFHNIQCSFGGSWVKDFVASLAGKNNAHNVNSSIQVVIPPNTKIDPKGCKR